MEKRRLISILLLVLVVASIIYFSNKPINKKDYFQYNGFKVYNTNPAVYDVEIYLKNDKNPHYISIRYDPRELDDIEIERHISEKVLKDKVFITLTPELTSVSVIAVAEMSKILGNQFLFNIPISSALTYEKENIPIRTCEDSTQKTAVILLKLSDKTQVSSKEECIIVEGQTEEDIIKASTKLMLNTLKISN